MMSGSKSNFPLWYSSENSIMLAGAIYTPHPPPPPPRKKKENNTDFLRRKFYLRTFPTRHMGQILNVLRNLTR